MTDLAHPETCQRCGSRNACWHAPSPLWNAVMRDPISLVDAYSIVCPVCFIELAEAKGLGADGNWCLRPHGVVIEGLWQDSQGRVWDEEQCLWVDSGEA